jgi:mono/diheme cytochrome c family protein
MNLCRLALVACILGMASHAYALPAYAKKENKNCAFCHTNPKGGGKRTAAGEWYKAHKHSLVGFKEPGKPAPKKK